MPSVRVVTSKASNEVISHEPAPPSNLNEELLPTRCLLRRQSGSSTVRARAWRRYGPFRPFRVARSDGRRRSMAPIVDQRELGSPDLAWATPAASARASPLDDQHPAIRHRDPEDLDRLATQP